jgi:tetratricopeptide (TPR) repeat protein
LRRRWFPVLAGTLLYCCFNRAASGQPGDAYRQGAEAFAGRDYPKAVERLRKAESEAPGSSDALLLCAKALVHLDRYAEAGQSLRAYITNHPGKADAQFLLGYVLFRQNRPRDSLAVYTEAAALERPRADDFKIVGLDYVLLNDYAEAIRWLERSVKENPADAEACYSLGRAYYTQNFFDRAIAAFGQALKLDPSLGKAHNNLGLALAAQNRLEDAAAAYRRAIAVDAETGKRSEQPYINLAGLLVDGNRASEALQLLTTARQIDPKSDRIENLRGRALLSEGRLVEAEAAFRAALAIQPDSGALHYQLGRVLKRLAKNDEAAREFERSRTLLGTHPTAPPEGQTAAQTAGQMPAQTATLQEAARLIEKQDLANAEALLHQVLDQSPDDALALNLLGLVRVNQRNPSQAQDLFRRAIEKAPHLAGPHVNLAQLYGKDRAPAAIAELGSALKLTPENQQARLLLRTIAGTAGSEAARSGNPKQALALMLDALAILPQDPDILVDTSLAAMENGAYGDAERYLLDALRVRPDLARATYALARAYLADSKAQEAEQQMRRYLTARPDDATAHYGLGYILAAEQKTAEARAAFEKSLALQPEQTESLFQLGELDLQEEQRDRARERYAQVLARDPRHAGALTGMGVLAYRAGGYADAESALERAVAIAPSYQKGHYYYALTLKKLGKDAEATREFRTSSDLQKHDAPKALLIPDRP